MVQTKADTKVPPRLPAPFEAWFAARAWRPRAHQLELLAHARKGNPCLLIAPTGAGKTLAGFLPSLIDLAQSSAETQKIHTLYISPLKALAVDVARNLEQPIAEMGLNIRVETRTGDTPPSRKQRQKYNPPDILMTTPEQVALLIANAQAQEFFGDLKRIIIDELHALTPNKRGALLSLGLARLVLLAPGAVRTGLSATVKEVDELRRYLVPQIKNMPLAALVKGEAGADPVIEILQTKQRVPWSGHSARYAYGDIYQAIQRHNMVLIFVNTRAQAEVIFQELWHINELNLAIALHHGSLDVGQRRKVEAAMVAGTLRCVVATSTLDLGVDWGDVDLVINIGAPKGSSRLLQRIGRANHKLDVPSLALMVPANRFEVLECRAACEAVAERQQDSNPMLHRPLDVLAQHVLGMAVAAPFAADDLFREVITAAPYANLTRVDFDDVVEFVATGGYALKTYDRYARLKLTKEGLYRLSHPKVAQQYRMNVGTIVEAPMLKVRLVKSLKAINNPGVSRGGRVLGEIEENFIDQLVVGDTFTFGGEILRFEGLQETDAFVTRAKADAPKIPSYMGGKFPLSTYLAARVRKILAEPKSWNNLPGQVQHWLQLQKAKSIIPKRNELLVETFPRADKYYLVCYPFEGRLAHQTLGMLLTRRLERARARPMGFVANEYALAVWGLRNLNAMCREGSLSLEDLFDQDMLGDDLETWLAESSLMKRTFRNCAIISGLIERRVPGREKTGRQVTFSTDLIYDVLLEHEPSHVLLRAAWDDASEGLLDISRLGDLLKRARGHIRHVALAHISPLAVPVMLEIGREPVYGEANEYLLANIAEDMIEEAERLV